MARVKWKWNIEGFAALRMDAALVGAMEAAMSSAVAGTPFEVEVWPHAGIKAGPRTSVQAWARTAEARRLARSHPEYMAGLLSRAGV